MNTFVQSKNQKYNSLSSGEINILNSISLRKISMKILFPNDLNIPFIQKPYMSDCIVDKPITYLSWFRDVIDKKLPFDFMIIRNSEGSEDLFEGNIKVSLEDYSISESAENNGDFIADLNLLEYKDIKVKQINPIGNSGKYSIINKRQTKEISKTYTVKPGDTLWKISKLEYNDGAKYTEIARLNNISNPSLIKVGQVLILK